MGWIYLLLPVITLIDGEVKQGFIRVYGTVGSTGGRRSTATTRDLLGGYGHWYNELGARCAMVKTEKRLEKDGKTAGYLRYCPTMASSRCTTIHTARPCGLKMEVLKGPQWLRSATNNEITMRYRKGQ